MCLELVQDLLEQLEYSRERIRKLTTEAIAARRVAERCLATLIEHDLEPTELDFDIEEELLELTSSTS